MTRAKLETRVIDGTPKEGQICSKCLTWKTKEEYNKDSRKKSGIRSICKVCQSSEDKKYRTENREKVSQRLKDYYENNKEKIMEYRKENKEHFDEYFEKYRDKNREIIRKRNKIYRENNLEAVKGRVRRYHEDNKEYLRLYSKKYYETNKEKFRLNNRNREAIKRDLPNDLTEKQQKHLLRVFKGCALTESADFHWDHIIPLSTGHGGTTYGNMIPLRSDLNLSKKDNNIFEWFEMNRQRFNLSQEKFNTLIDWLAEINGVSVEDYRNHVYWCHDNPHSIEDLRENNEGEAI